MSAFWNEVEQLAASTAETVVPALLNAYLAKEVGAPGAVPITIGNVGRIAGAVAAQTVLQHLQAAAAAPVIVPQATGSAAQ